MLNCDEIDEDDDDNNLANRPLTGTQDNDTRNSTGKRCRCGDASVSKRAHGGRAPKEEDWWSQVDKWFLGKRKEWGENMSSPQWKRSAFFFETA